MDLLVSKLEYRNYEIDTTFTILLKMHTMIKERIIYENL